METTKARARYAAAAAPDTGSRAASSLDVCRRVLGSDRAVAEVLDVSASQISRWRRSQTPDPDNADRLGGLALVVEMLERWIEPELVREWLHGPNAHLQDRTPAFLVQQGRVADVIGAIEAEKAGVFG